MWFGYLLQFRSTTSAVPSFSSGSAASHLEQFLLCSPEHDRSDPEDFSGLYRLKVDRVVARTKGLVISGCTVTCASN